MHRKSRKLAIILGIMSFAVMFAFAVFAIHQWQHKRIKESYLHIGLQAYENCRWKTAASNLGKYLSFSPGDTDVLLKYADAQLHIRPCRYEHIEQAIAAYRAVLRKDRTNKIAVEQLTNLYLQTAAPAEAENIARRYLSNKNDYSIAMLCAAAMYEQRKFQQAAEIAREIIAECPNSLKAYAIMYKIARSTNDESYGKSRDWLNLCIKNNPDSANAYIMAASFYIDENKYDTAVKMLDKAETLDMPEPAARIELAWQLIRLDMNFRARRHLLVAEKINPNISALWKSWAQIAVREDSKAEMIRAAQSGLKALANDPWDFIPTAAELFIRADQIEQGVKYIDKMKYNEIDPPAVMWLQGLELSKKEKDYDALKKWHIAEKMGYDSDKITSEMVKALIRVGDNESALMLLRKKTIEQPEHYKWHFLLAQLAFNDEKYSEAVVHSQKALALRPNSMDAYILNIKIKMNLPQGNSQISRCETFKNLLQQLNTMNSTESNILETELLKFSCAVECEEFEKAEKILNALKESCPDAIEAEMAFIDLLLAKNQQQEVEVKLEEMINKHPYEVGPVICLAEILTKSNKQAKCEKQVMDALLRITDTVSRRKLALALSNLYKHHEDIAKQHAFLVNILKTMPDDVPLRRELFDICIWKEQFSEAEAIIEKIKELEGIDGHQWKYLQAKLWSNDKYFDNYYHQITALLQEILSENPYDNESRLLLAEVYEKASENQLALITYRAALNQSPYDLNIKTKIIDTLFKVKEFDSAETLLRETIKQDYVNGRILKLNVENLLRQNKITEAVNFLETIDVPDESRFNLNLLMASLKIKMKDYNNAREILNHLYEQKPNCQIKSLLVELDICTNNYEHALQLCNEMIQENKTANSLLLRGRTYAACGKIELAQQDYDEAVNVEPENAQAFEARGLFYRSTGNYEKAFEDLEKAYQLQLSNVDIVKYMLNSLADMNNPADVWKCRQILNHAIANYPKDPELLWYKARLLITEDKPASVIQAQNILEEITKNNPDFSSGWSLLAEVYLNQNKTSDAMNAILQGIKNCGNDKILLLLKAKTEMRISPEMAVLTLEHLNEHMPEDLETVLLLSDMYINIGQNKKSITLLSDYEAKCPAGQTEKTGIALAMALYKNNEIERANEKLQAILIKDPNNCNVFIAQCEILFLQKNWGNLKTNFGHLLANHPHTAEDCFKLIKKFLLSPAPPPPSVSEYLLREILKYKPAEPSVLLTLAIHLHNYNQFEEAAYYYQKVLEIDSDNKIAINNLAWILCECNNEYSQALKLADYGVKIYPDYASLRDTRGLIFYRMKDYRKASEEFLESMQLNDKKSPSYVISLFHRGLALNKMGHNENAHAYMKKAITLNQLQGGLTMNEVSEAQNILTFLPTRFYASDTNK